MKRPNSTAIIARTLALNAVLSTLTFGSMEPRDDGAFVHDRIVQANDSQLSTVRRESCRKPCRHLQHQIRF